MEIYECMLNLRKTPQKKLDGQGGLSCLALCARLYIQ